MRRHVEVQAVSVACMQSEMQEPPKRAVAVRCIASYRRATPAVCRRSLGAVRYLSFRDNGMSRTSRTPAHTLLTKLRTVGVHGHPRADARRAEAGYGSATASESGAHGSCVARHTAVRTRDRCRLPAKAPPYRVLADHIHGLSRLRAARRRSINAGVALPCRCSTSRSLIKTASSGASFRKPTRWSRRRNRGTGGRSMSRNRSQAVLSTCAVAVARKNRGRFARYPAFECLENLFTVSAKKPTVVYDNIGCDRATKRSGTRTPIKSCRCLSRVIPKCCARLEPSSSASATRLPLRSRKRAAISSPHNTARMRKARRTAAGSSATTRPSSAIWSYSLARWKKSLRAPHTGCIAASRLCLCPGLSVSRRA